MSPTRRAALIVTGTRVKLGVVEVQLGETRELAGDFAGTRLPLFSAELESPRDVGTRIDLEIGNGAFEIDDSGVVIAALHS